MTAIVFPGRIEAQIIVPAGVSITATNSGGGPTAIPITPGGYFLSGTSGLVAFLQNQLNALRTPANWSVLLTSAAGQININCSTGSGTYSIAWTGAGATLRNILGFTADITAVTQGVATLAPQQAKGVWYPDCPVMCDLDPAQAPKVSDKRSSISARGDVYTIVGNTRYRQRNLRYTHVGPQRVWENKAQLPNASWEMFHIDTQQATGSTGWFAAGSRVQVYDNNNLQFGAGTILTTTGWQFEALPELDTVKQNTPGYTGLWEIDLGDMVSTG